MKDLISKVHFETLTHFVYVPDKILHPDYFDRWLSFADTVEARETFRGDCDDFALTTAELLLRKQVPWDKVKIVYCEVETGEAHLVTACDHWILDNRHRTIMYWKDLKYTWKLSMSMNECGIWRKFNLI